MCASIILILFIALWFTTLIIKNFKAHYRQLLLSYVISKIDSCSTASEIVRSVNILVAIRWVALAWSRFKESTIRKCFKSAGALDNNYDAALPSQDADPFLEADVQMELEGLIEKAVPGERCSVQEYIDGDDSLAVCTDLDSENWEVNFMAELGQDTTGNDRINESDDETPGEEVSPPKITSYSEAVESIENVQQFLVNQGHVQESLSLGSWVDTIAFLKLSRMNCQTSLWDFLSH